MIRHVVLIRWKDATAAAEIEEVTRALTRLPSLVPGIRAYRCGADAGFSEGNHDYAIVADFADRAAYLTYAAHPEHQRVIAERIRPLLAERAAVQLELDDD